MRLFSRSRLRGTEGGRLYTTAQVWVPDGLRGAFYGRSKSRILASIRGVASRRARAEHDNGKPTYQLFCSTAVKALCFVAATAYNSSRLCVDHYYACVDIAYFSRVCAVCAMIRVRVCRCVQVCALEPQISAFRFFYSVCCCCLQLRTLLLWMCGPLPCILGHVCVYVLCVCSVYVQLRYNSNRTARLCGPLLCVC